MTKSIGGAVKGGICVYVPGAVATGIGIAGTATLENYLYSTISGDSSPEALSRAFINGGLEGLTAGSLKWIGNKITAKKSVKTDSKLQPVGDAELEYTIGGAKDPEWKPGEGASGADNPPNTETKTDWFVGPDGNVASSLDDYDWYTGIYNSPSNVRLEGLGSTGRILPNDVMEQTVMKNALKNPFENIPGSRDVSRVAKNLGDTRWAGWEKWQIVYRTNEGRNITIHFNYDPINKFFDDFKFK